MSVLGNSQHLDSMDSWTAAGGLTGSYRNCELRKGQNDKAEVMGERSLVSHTKKKLFSEFGKVE